jgi:hypothetical protein
MNSSSRIVIRDEMMDDMTVSHSPRSNSRGWGARISARDVCR